MCGIAGFVAPPGLLSRDALSNIASAMAGALAHRGPDDAGIWCDPDLGVALAHRRLAILDRSAAGHQPMVSPSGRFVLVFNGEIYNHLLVRRELNQAHLAPSWRGHSDTETLSAAIEAWGVEATMRRMVGMFAIALWDREQRSLTLIRDRMGEKPLYFGWSGGVLLLASELKALRAFSDFRCAIDRSSLVSYFRYSYIPTPYSVYRRVYKLWPGTILTLRANALGDCPWEERSVPSPPFSCADARMTSYWSLAQVVQHGMAAASAGSRSDAVEELERAIAEAVRLQQLSDVPVGAFLSGGIDSSTVVALMQAQSSRPVRTFSIGFRQPGFDETKHAASVARYLGTAHTEMYVTEADAAAVVPRLPDVYDEPFADSSQIPTFLVAQLARRAVTVSLSGDGGDELFGGYPRYLWTRRLWRLLNLLPRFARRGLGCAIRTIPSDTWRRLDTSAMRFISRASRFGEFGSRLHKLGEAMPADTPEELYRYVISHWKEPSRLVLGGQERADVYGAAVGIEAEQRMRFDQRSMYRDSIAYLPDDILVKLDRAAMAVGLETRVPLLDHRVVELAWRIPRAEQIAGGQGKRVLRRVLYRHVPRGLVDRPKMGFSVPFGDWLRGGLRDWAESLLERRRLEAQGFLAPELVRRAWGEHLAGRGSWRYLLWDVLMFQAWMERWGGSAGHG